MEKPKPSGAGNCAVASIGVFRDHCADRRRDRDRLDDHMRGLHVLNDQIDRDTVGLRSLRRMLRSDHIKHCTGRLVVNHDIAIYTILVESGVQFPVSTRDAELFFFGFAHLFPPPHESVCLRCVTC